MQNFHSFKYTPHGTDVAALKAAHRTLAEFAYEPAPVRRGYARKTLYVNVGTGEIRVKDVTQEMIDKFIGGRGFGLWYLWHATKPETRWNDPENEIVIGGGPICGITQYPGTGKSLCVSLSPTTGVPIDSNVGGYAGPLLKTSGFDALEIQGIAKTDVVVVIDGQRGVVRIEEAPGEAQDSHLAAEQFTEMYATDDADRVNVSVISSGAGGQHSLIGCLNFSFYDLRRRATRLKQAGRGGIGTVLRHKKVKAIVVHGRPITANLNDVADFDRVAKAGLRLHRELAHYDDVQCKMRSQGTAHLVEIMDAHDLLPVHNFQYGGHPDSYRIRSTVWERYFTQGIPDGCWYGCSMACAHAVDGFELRTGPYAGHRVIVDGPEYETIAGLGSCCGIFDPEVILESNFYCDTYGIDTISYGTICAFVMECWQRGILNPERTGGLELTWGNGAAHLEMMHQLARGEGFGAIAGQGVRRMKAIFLEQGWTKNAQLLDDIGMENKGLEYSQYVSKESLAQQGGYALTNKGPQHDEAWLIFMDMVSNLIPSFEDKAEALHYFPLFRTWFGLNGLCKLPWNDVEPADNRQTPEPAKVPAHVANYLDLVAGVTGRELDRAGLIRESEGVYNFQRVFDIRQGKGVRKFDHAPYRSVGPVSKEEYESRRARYDKQLVDLIGRTPEEVARMSTEEKMAAHREWRTARFEKLSDTVYRRRGWTWNAVPKPEHLKALGIDFPEVMAVVEGQLEKDRKAGVKTE
jgi:aldehyde:ferredoxin oxidoreductase